MHTSNGILALFLSLWIPSLHAAIDMVVWQCSSHDRTEQYFNGFSNNEWSSLRNAMKLCKKQSKNPKTCRVSQEDCDALVNGQSIRPWWQCKAMDSLGYVWIGGYFRVADNAILEAKSRCHSFSAVPATCFTSFFTCKKLNPL
ncbi:hypothetical protein [Legionella micdadei]|uniref:DUF4189 domain-containing protein n=1 Tax=Legionella micdadei TaxID=451 RepID=A0A1G5G3B6_LEGMI|nr:hypothetical protein [Legionella micdadei]ARG97020.1 hypothetical protein B6N58_04675 [Legionella micdadei]ARH00725.1 hypothetical protein B6V88_10025 [Legionella micdadei]KTD26735.1 hypothetical protein Lmic_2829 [Legionella micdadei]NSL18240.1 hypothetical protein [Legionella micdadei]SCY46073.1 hypothetical protein SAMN02982997_01774 [Legionella micdadei]